MFSIGTVVGRVSQATTPTRPRAARGFDGIQALRALAALAIAALHVLDEAGALAGTPGQAPYPWVHLLPLEAGVDLFFVISGFVMVWASWGSFGHLRSVGPFVARRLLRILPLYWGLTAATVLVALAAPGALSDGLRDGWGYVAASFAFIPWRRADGFVQPVLRLGWTLEYEMLFYVAMACALPLRRGLGLGAVLLAFAALALLGQAVSVGSAAVAFWTDPIILEFGLGVLVAVAARQGWRAGWAGPVLLVILVLLLLAFPPGQRVLAWGLPAALLVFCALGWHSLPGWLVLLGDASYALYLVHPFPMRALRVLFARLPAPVNIPLYVGVTLAVCIAAAVALHLVVEQPVLRWGRRRTTRADAAPAGE